MLHGCVVRMESSIGYLKYAASTFPKQYMALVLEVLPLRVEAPSPVSVNIIGHLDIVSVPPRYMHMPPENFKGHTIGNRSQAPKFLYCSPGSPPLKRIDSSE